MAPINGAPRTCMSRIASQACCSVDRFWTTKAWGSRVDTYLSHLVRLFSPELIILGGGASKRAAKWFDRLDPGCELAVAALANDAGIAGAALSAQSGH